MELKSLLEKVGAYVDYFPRCDRTGFGRFLAWEKHATSEECEYLNKHEFEAMRTLEPLQDSLETSSSYKPIKRVGHLTMWVPIQ
jgi:hypothetical protein